jgi:hypothetical protein
MPGVIIAGAAVPRGVVGAQRIVGLVVAAVAPSAGLDQ